MFLLRLTDYLNKARYSFLLKVLYQKRFSYGNIRIRGDFHVFLEEGARVCIGSAFFNRGCSLSAHQMIRIGNNCIFGENVKIYDHNHIYSRTDVPISKQGFTVEEVIIGDNCWIGSNVTILKGVTIGNNSVIGANCIIYKDIPDNSIVKFKSEVTIENRYDNAD